MTKKSTEYTRRYRQEHPWVKSYEAAKSRCTNPNKNSYPRYGGRGIKFLMTLGGFEYLWNRDKAYLMASPSIDRIDGDGDYVIENCRYMEKNENARRRRKTSCVHGHKFTKENTYVNKKGGRHCTICRRDADKRYRLKLALSKELK